MAVVLVVDDTEDTRDLYVEYLTDQGYTVLHAENGKAGLELAAARKPDVVVMDLSMPVMDGWEATKRIKADPALGHVLVIAVSGHATDDGTRRAREAGADAICPKPCLPGEVLKMIRELLGRRA